ncbi:pollen-specific leucine-rich repeat extensin-like protein 1 [Odontomachus brunneus]|uniref:pollen-specific leucine-rich repeat extensin-like protein 1 n=1 Tax=Odontomachus brunneus TaxID=486640 RepID=UPI0013F2825E|nr:pollen-specific leucine-rich repeat extensin-like protein 1 [Odontomachus brunneus]
MIEDLDAIEPAPLESQRTPTRLCSCEEVDVAGTRERGDLRKIRSTEVRWATSSFLSPDDAIWDLRRRTSEGTEFRWELHTSSTDLDLARKTRCSCHSLTPEEKKPEGTQRGDLRKHHSAETDKWSVRPDHVLTPMHDLRKHSSDDTRFAREARWLQVPDVMPNPKPRCTCPKVKTPAPASPVPAPALEPKVIEEPEKPAPQKEERRLYYSKSLTPEESAAPWEKPEMKRQASEQPKPIRIEKSRERPKLERSAQVRSESSRKWGLKEKEKVISPIGESKKPIRARWAMKPHVSLPAEKKAPKWYRSQDETKSKSLRERPKYSIRRSMSPEPDPRQVNKLENRIVRRLISPEITITSTKWAPYEDSSPLPTIGIKKREQKHISEIKWTPYDESPSDIPVEVIDDKKWSPFHNVTPTHCPPPVATPSRKSDDEQFRWRMLNMVAPFPLYQGGWKDESPEKTPPKKVTTPEDLSPPVWSPMVPATPTSKRKSIAPQPESPSRYSPSERRPSKQAPRLTRKGAFRAKTMVPTTNPLEDRLPQATAPAPAPPPVIVRAASEEPRRQRPQLMRSKALLEVPVPIDATKRSLSEEGPRMRPRERPRAPGRARSEEVPKYDDPWFEDESPELREYVTTV